MMSAEIISLSQVNYPSGVSTFIVWAMITFIHIQFRRGLKAQGVSANELPFRAVLYPLWCLFWL
jgi:amino acid transporter